MKTKPRGEGFAEKKSRRKFLLAASLGSAGAVAAVATLQKPGAETAAPAAEAPQGDGYRMTEHIQKYYKTTEV
jgi:hypothetical protein